MFFFKLTRARDAKTELSIGGRMAACNVQRALQSFLFSLHRSLPAAPRSLRTSEEALPPIDKGVAQGTEAAVRAASSASFHQPGFYQSPEPIALEPAKCVHWNAPLPAKKAESSQDKKLRRPTTIPQKDRDDRQHTEDVPPLIVREPDLDLRAGSAQSVLRLLADIPHPVCQVFSPGGCRATRYQVLRQQALLAPWTFQLYNVPAGHRIEMKDPCFPAIQLRGVTEASQGNAMARLKFRAVWRGAGCLGCLFLRDLFRSLAASLLPVEFHLILPAEAEAVLIKRDGPGTVGIHLVAKAIC
mmetsp:Transcript_22990/g.50808  ORF Transcript_22990/g.50808 Transcript_22990/m.50808 type:complete len:300 (+) Transcript_22990:198-1097(+)